MRTLRWGPLTTEARSLATCNYTAYVESMGLAVRTSVGYPRFWRGPKLEYARSCAPHGIFGQLTDRDAYLLSYRAHLDAHSGDVGADLGRLARAHPGQRLVLLCFERLSEPGKWCHRTVLGQWLEEHTGLDVPELGPVHSTPVAPRTLPAAPVQGTLL